MQDGADISQIEKALGEQIVTVTFDKRDQLALRALLGHFFQHRQT